MSAFQVFVGGNLAMVTPCHGKPCGAGGRCVGSAPLPVALAQACAFGRGRMTGTTVGLTFECEHACCQLPSAAHWLSSSGCRAPYTKPAHGLRWRAECGVARGVAGGVAATTQSDNECFAWQPRRPRASAATRCQRACTWYGVCWRGDRACSVGSADGDACASRSQRAEQASAAAPHLWSYLFPGPRTSFGLHLVPTSQPLFDKAHA